MLRKIIVGWVCLIGALIAAIGLSIQAGVRRLRERVTAAREPPAADADPDGA
jgi:hypothetical protein